MNNHTSTDIHFLEQALTLAAIQRGFCAPNPAVGAIIVNQTNDIIATGYHLGPGQPHAEIDALNKIKEPTDLHTLYVTLEPCCHVGRTPPCTDAIINAGFKRVVYGFNDPNPLVSGQGARLLYAAGIDCEHISIKAIDDFYESYAYWQQTHYPFVTAKLALTLDGKIAGKHGEPVQITGSALNAKTHLFRKASDAILSTVKTIIADDPQLNARIENNTFAKPLYLLDSQLQLPLNAKIFITAKHITVFHAHDANQDKKNALMKKDVRCIAVNSSDNRLDLTQVLQHIGQEGMHDLWVEAGGQCFSALIDKKLIQRAYLYLAPRWLGDGKSAFKNDFLLPRGKSTQWQQHGDDVFCEIRW